MRANPNWTSSSLSLLTLKLTDKPETPGWEQSWVIRSFLITAPDLSMENCLATPTGVTAMPGMRVTALAGIGRAHPLVTSLS